MKSGKQNFIIVIDSFLALSIICQQSWLAMEVPVDWRLANVMPIYKKGWKDDPGNYRTVSLTSLPGKVM